MNRAQADFQTRLLVVNLICAAGMALAVIVKTILLGVGITYLKHEPSFLDPQWYLNRPI